MKSVIQRKRNKTVTREFTFVRWSKAKQQKRNEVHCQSPRATAAHQWQKCWRKKIKRTHIANKYSTHRRDRECHTADTHCTAILLNKEHKINRQFFVFHFVFTLSTMCDDIKPVSFHSLSAQCIAVYCILRWTKINEYKFHTSWLHRAFARSLQLDGVNLYV